MENTLSKKHQIKYGVIIVLSYPEGWVFDREPCQFWYRLRSLIDNLIYVLHKNPIKFKLENVLSNIKNFTAFNSVWCEGKTFSIFAKNRSILYICRFHSVCTQFVALAIWVSACILRRCIYSFLTGNLETFWSLDIIFILSFAPYSYSAMISIFTILNNSNSKTNC